MKKSKGEKSIISRIIGLNLIALQFVFSFPASASSSSIIEEFQVKGSLEEGHNLLSGSNFEILFSEEPSLTKDFNQETNGNILVEEFKFTDSSRDLINVDSLTSSTSEHVIVVTPDYVIGSWIYTFDFAVGEDNFTLALNFEDEENMNFIDGSLTNQTQGSLNVFSSNLSNVSNISSVPEPVSNLSLFALATLGVTAALKRKLKSSKFAG
ncbi:MAG: hypothetical protein F6K06_05150 [Okeania sp. SIO1H4]|nr:hypothetical protein [Okeania sp. SIO1H4]